MGSDATGKSFSTNVIELADNVSNTGTTVSKENPDMITIYIDGVKYQKPRPKTYKEAMKLVDSLTDMYNKLDSGFIEYKKTAKEGQAKTLADLDTVNKTLAKTQLDLETLRREAEDVNKKTIDLSKTKNRFTVFGILGPTLSSDGLTGTSFGVLGDYRFFRNIHAGLNLNLSVYNYSRIDGSIGIVLGYSVY